ncbi:hypothetical protein BC835DRAFT_293190 [Cytidiella melzeri]|nr:hypothetical protein BC835DRAFT_293190 [Cytidiella melzeri]
MRYSFEMTARIPYAVANPNSKLYALPSVVATMRFLRPFGMFVTFYDHSPSSDNVAKTGQYLTGFMRGT